MKSIDTVDKAAEKVDDIFAELGIDVDEGYSGNIYSNSPVSGQYKTSKIVKKLIAKAEAKEIREKTKLADKRKKKKYQIKQLRIGMTKNMVIDVFGRPRDKQKTVTKTGEKLTWYYFGEKNNRGNMKYSLSIKIKNNEVVSWSEE